MSELPAFSQKCKKPITTHTPDCLQVNVGKLCNQACKHCHVDAGPKRTEIMTWETMEWVLDAVGYLAVRTVDITGGAPEMNPRFRDLVRELRARDVPQIIDRCNLTVLLEPGFGDMADFLREQRVEITASLPFYIEDNVDRQRGRDVFKKSIDALRLLNRLGYGTEVPLNLVYNPQGAYLPPDQDELRTLYKKFLFQELGIVFNELYTITNMPISRFAHYLKISNNYDRYMKKLVSRFNPVNLDGLMCRSLISVGWDGVLYDCDFNQMLEMPLRSDKAPHIRDIRQIVLNGREIETGPHCFGCTAGGGSSCGGSLDKKDSMESQPMAV